MPVVTPNRGAASMLTVNAVRNASVFSSPCGGKPELVHALAGERETDHPLRLQHEVDQRGRHELRSADQIALVLAILVIGDDDELAGAMSAIA